jgi:hypothetical protein
LCCCGAWGFERCSPEKKYSSTACQRKGLAGGWPLALDVGIYKQHNVVERSFALNARILTDALPRLPDRLGTGV